MRDRLLADSLTRLASEAAVRLSALVAAGDQIPFDVDAETGGDGDSPFYSYRPRTARFVREREAELRALPAFGPAREAVEATDVAAAFLEACGEQVPAEPGERAAQTLVSFLASLWDGRTDLALDGQRLEAALASLEAETRDAEDADVLVAPLVGLRMPPARLDLPHGVRIVRADTVEAPVEAMRSEGMGRAAWQPQFLAVAEQGEGAGSAAAALRQLRELVSVMRLYKAGGVGLGPYAFAPTGEGSWRRLSTGAPATRPGGYELSEAEAGELAGLAAALEARPDPDGALAWAVRRFELGCGRKSVLDGLSDQLLALRAALEGQGPVGASLPLRAAALLGSARPPQGPDSAASRPSVEPPAVAPTTVSPSAEPPGAVAPTAASPSADRVACREWVERALELERALMSGAPLDRGASMELARWVEESVRTILREAALGELGADLGAAADESLIAAGLAGGDAEITVASQDTPEPRPPESAVEESAQGGRTQHPSAPGRAATGPGTGEGPARNVESQPEQEDPVDRRARIAEPHREQEDPSDRRTRIVEPIPGEDEIKITATNWLEEVEAGESTLDFPSVEADAGRRERVDPARVRHLFPVPEDADWQVRELDYDHYRRRRAG